MLFAPGSMPMTRPFGGIAASRSLMLSSGIRAVMVQVVSGRKVSPHRMASIRRLQIHGGGAAPRLARSLAWLLLSLAAIHIAVFALVVWLTIVRAPSQNMLDWLDAYWQYRQGGSFWAYLVLFFQEHRLVWVRLLAAVDAGA